MVAPFDLLDPLLQERIVVLENQDRKEREGHVERRVRLRQIPRKTGEFLYQYLLSHAGGYPEFLGVEIGTSGGYSTLWQGAALHKLGFGTLISLDNDPRKHKMALETVNGSTVQEFIELICIDAKQFLKSYSGPSINYVFLDAEKEDYFSFLGLFLENNRFFSGSVLIADNAISHEYELLEFIGELERSRMASHIVVPVGKGLALIYKH
ncbi:MAG: O-methyltransferase [Candidatus Heimdallarchaeota archaeon]